MAVGEGFQQGGFLLFRKAGVVPVVLPGEEFLAAVFQKVIADYLHKVCHNDSPITQIFFVSIYEENLHVKRCRMEIFAQRVKELRKERKKTQTEMAQYLKIGLRAYQYYESATNYPNIPGLLKLADYFEVTTDYLLGRSPERK